MSGLDAAVTEALGKPDRLIAALRAASFEQDSEWHVAPFNYVTKPRALVEEAAETIDRLLARLREVESVLSAILANADDGEEYTTMGDDFIVRGYVLRKALAALSNSPLEGAAQ